MRTCADYSGALRLLRKRPHDPDGFPKAMMVSAVEQTGLAEAWAEMEHLAEWRKEQGHWRNRRAAQARYWFEQDVRQSLLAGLDRPEVQAEMKRLGQAVAEGVMPAHEATEQALERLQSRAGE